jgi:hypothetical protein
MPRVATPASGALPAAERLLIRGFVQSTSATTDRGISLGSVSKQSVRANLVERSTREAVWGRSKRGAADQPMPQHLFVIITKQLAACEKPIVREIPSQMRPSR